MVPRASLTIQANRWSVACISTIQANRWSVTCISSSKLRHRFEVTGQAVAGD